MSVVLHRQGPARVPRSFGRRTFGSSVRRVGLTIFFASITINAALGIYAVVTPNWGDTQAKILLTSLCVTGAVLLGLACEPAWERGLLGPVPLGGVALGVAAFALAIGAVWAEPADDPYGKLTGSTFTLALACVMASLLALARLTRRHVWVLRLTLGLLGVGAAMLAMSFWLAEDNETYLRVMGVVLIALAAFAVTVPVLHWIDRGALALEGVTDAVHFCPYCGKKLVGEIGAELHCGRCGRDFSIAAHVAT